MTYKNKTKSGIIAVLLLITTHILFAQDVKIGLTNSRLKNLEPTPPMGWNSWNWFGN